MLIKNAVLTFMPVCVFGTSISMVHIPKTAGNSFYDQYKDQVTFARESPGADERSYSYLKQHDGQKHKLISFFRDPRKHVYSMYLECKWDHWGKRVTRNTDFPRDPDEDEQSGYTPAFDSWLKHFNMFPTTTEMYNCYQPYNMQTRYFETEDREPHNYADDVDGFTYRGKSRINDLWFVGITEYYTASSCLFEYKMFGEIPDHCDCTHEQKKSPPNEKRVTHGVPRHPFHLLTDNTVEMIDRLVYYDKLLYTFALKRFERDVMDFTNRTGISLCGI